MRWDDLFADLEGQLHATQSAQFMADVADMTRAERASVELAARVVASAGQSITVTLSDGTTVSGVIVDASTQWLLLGASGPQTLIPLPAVTMLSGLSVQAAPLSEVERRLSLGYALRALSRDRSHVVVHTASGQVRGVINAVGADHLELLTETGMQLTVPHGAIICLRGA